MARTMTADVPTTRAISDEAVEAAMCAYFESALTPSDYANVADAVKNRIRPRIAAALTAAIPHLAQPSDEAVDVERERIARCLRNEAHGRNDAAFNRGVLFAARCVLADYDRYDHHSFCANPAECPRCGCHVTDCVEHVEGMHTDFRGDSIVHIGCGACRPSEDPALAQSSGRGADHAREIEEWASWIEHGSEAAGLPEPFTLQAVVTWMRSGQKPFGVYANTDTADEVTGR